MASDITLACAVALATLPDMGPIRINALRNTYGFHHAWERLVDGSLLDDPSVRQALGGKAESLATEWRRAALRIEPEAVLVAHHAAGVSVHLLGDPTYPEALAADIDPPPLLFARGYLSALTGPRVAIVGTRRCTQGGRQTARDMGHELAEKGVRVVSGLALGIDGAAHEGALRSKRSLPVIGVVATGLDRVYPVRHRTLWESVANRGLLLAEVPLGTAPSRWRFPARNRIIAAVADVVVVIESHAKGGALSTADEAIRRDRLLMAVPGSVRSPAAVGTNQLLYDGVDPARGASDVLTALGFAVPPPTAPDSAGSVQSGRAESGRGESVRAESVPTESVPTESGRAESVATESGRAESRAEFPSPLDPLLERVLSHIDTDPTSVDELAFRTGLPLPELALAIVSLEQRGLVARSGTWLERVR